MEPDVIVKYTDREAVADGVLVPVDFGDVNRVTRAVFDHFTRPLGSSPVTGPVTDITRLARVTERMLRKEPDTDGWRTGTDEGKALWLVPNELGRLTLMFPEDW